MYLDEIHTTIRGVPCVIAVTEYSAGCDHYVSGDRSEEGVPGCVSYEIRKVTGSRYEWLENQLSTRDCQAILQLIESVREEYV